MGLREVRLRYSIVVNYASSLYRVLIGAGFLILLARKLPLQEFGLWGLIFIVSNILAWPVRLWVYWAQRHIVYELKDNKTLYKDTFPTALALTSIYAIISTIGFLLLGYVYEILLGYGFNYFLVAVPIMIALEYTTLLEDLSITLQPEHVGLSNFLLDTVRIILAYVSIIYFHMGLYGVLLSVFIARIVKIAYLTIRVLLPVNTRLNPLNINWELAKLWFKAYRIPLLMILSQNLDSADRSIAPVVAGSVEPVAYLNIAYITRGPFAGGLYVFMGGLYAKLLRSPKGEYIEEVLRLLLLPAILLLVLITSLSKPIISLLNPEYIEAHTLLLPASIAFTLYNVELVLLGAIMGSEQFDKKITSIDSTGSFTNTTTYRALLLRFTRSLLVIASAGVIASMFKEALDQATVFVATRFIGFLVPLVLLYYYSRKLLEYRFPLKELTVFTIAGVLSYLLVMMLGGGEAVYPRFVDQLLILVKFSVIATIAYMSVCLLLSGWFRGLVKRILRIRLHGL